MYKNILILCFFCTATMLFSMDKPSINKTEIYWENFTLSGSNVSQTKQKRLKNSLYKTFFKFFKANSIETAIFVIKNTKLTTIENKKIIFNAIFYYPQKKKNQVYLLSDFNNKPDLDYNTILYNSQELLNSDFRGVLYFQKSDKILRKIKIDGKYWKFYIGAQCVQITPETIKKALFSKKFRR